MIIIYSIEELLQQIVSADFDRESFAYQQASTIIPMDIIHLIKDLYLRDIHQDRPKKDTIYKNFSLRQQQCISLLLKGKNNKQIAQHLNLSVRTVEKYIATIKVKMKVRSRLELVLDLMSHERFFLAMSDGQCQLQHSI